MKPTQYGMRLAEAISRLQKYHPLNRLKVVKHSTRSSMELYQATAVKAENTYAWI